MDDGTLVGVIDPASGRRQVVLRDAAGEERPLGVPGVWWGWESSATRVLADAVLQLLSGQVPLPQMAWDLGAEVFGNAEVCPPQGDWALPLADLDAWRRGWLRRPSSRIPLERALAGTLLLRPAAVELDPAVVRDRRERLACEHAIAAARDGRPVDLVAVQLAIEDLGLGDPPDYVRGLVDAAPAGPGPHWWAAQLGALARTPAAR